MGERIRTTISLEPEVYEVFKQMAEAGGVSVSRCMGDWLADTAEGAQLVAQKMQEARDAPKTVIREMQALTKGLQEELSITMSRLRQGSAATASGSAARPTPADAPSSNTGLKSPKKGRGQS